MTLASLSHVTRFGTVLPALVVGFVLLLSSMPAMADSHQSLCVEQWMSNTGSPLLTQTTIPSDAAPPERRTPINSHWLIPICSADGVSAIAPPPMSPLEDAHIVQGDDREGLWMSASLPQGPDHSPDYSSDAKHGLTVDDIPKLRSTFGLLRWLSPPTSQTPLGVSHMVYRPPRS